MELESTDDQNEQRASPPSPSHFRRIFPPTPSLSPKESAARWVLRMSEEIPTVISGAYAPKEWRALANQLWWLTLYERAFDALTWSILELMTKDSMSERIDQHLSGWSDRLRTRPPQERPEYRWLRQTLLSLSDTPSDTPSDAPIAPLAVKEKEEVLQYIRQSQEASKVQMHILTLLSVYHLKDPLALSRCQEWTARHLALGLSSGHCDPLIQGVIKQQMIGISEVSKEVSKEISHASLDSLSSFADPPKIKKDQGQDQGESTFTLLKILDWGRSLLKLMNAKDSIYHRGSL